MPISTDEFEAGAAEGDGSFVELEDGPLESEKELITSFLSERHDRAFTRREVVLGVDFSSTIETYGDYQGIVSEVTETATSGVGDVVASTIVVDDVNEALAALVEEGTVETTDVDVGGETETYYRLADGDADDR